MQFVCHSEHSYRLVHNGYKLVKSVHCGKLVCEWLCEGVYVLGRTCTRVLV